jgi:DNA-binding NtrC family response regulator
VVSTYESSEVAWAALRDGAVAELLMVDIDQGPGENATEFARRAKSLRPNLPVMLTSGQSKYMRDMRREEPGRWPLLIKPFSQDELAAAVSLALNDGFVRTQPSRNEI